jgi:acyl dehydratase
MAVMADGAFPFGAVGLVHIGNRIAQHRQIGIGEALTIQVRPTKLQPHTKGRTFSLQTKIKSGRQIIWESTSTMLRRGQTEADGTQSRGIDRSEAHRRVEELAPGGEWRLGGDLGRRYAAVSGDRNPIHMHAWSAKALGFPRAIAHGMWTKARVLGWLESRLPDAFAVDVRFRKPILLPGRIAFASTPDGDQIDFAVRDAKRGTPHLDGHLEPLEAKPRRGRKK